MATCVRSRSLATSKPRKYRTHPRSIIPDPTIALIISDRFTQSTESYPCKTKSLEQCVICFQKFVGPQVKPEHVYTDSSEEFKKFLKELKLLHEASTPYRSQTNGVVERVVRKVKEGTSCTLVQSGFEEAWWDRAMLCYCFLKRCRGSYGQR